MRSTIESDLYLTAKSIQIQGKVFPEFVMPEDRKNDSKSSILFKNSQKLDLADLIGLNRVDSSLNRKSEYNQRTPHELEGCLL